MRTKTLLCAAALAAGLATSALAQSNVYSLNVVGYYNVDAPAGQKIMIANQLHTTNDVLSNILPGPFADGTIFFFFNNGFSASPWDTDANAWSADFNLPPGTGGFLVSPTHQTLTFVGEVRQGSLTNKFIRNQKVITAPQPPIQQTLSQMNLPGEDGDIVFQFRNGGYSASPFDTDAAAWSVDFTNKVGEAFFYQKFTGLQTNWVQNFTVQ
jgi:hypothetical protein